MSPCWPPRVHRTSGFPRASGDEPEGVLEAKAAAEVFPARAGMSPSLTWRETRGWGFPRASGDEPRKDRTEDG